MKKLLLLLVVTAMALTTLTACRGDDDNDGGTFFIPDGHPLEMLAAALDAFPQYVDNGLQHVAGTTFHYGLLSTSTWSGVIGGNSVFGQAASDNELAVLLGTSNSLIAGTTMRTFGEGGVATATPDVEARTLTIQQHLDVYWHDGVPLTLYDLQYTFYVLAHPDNPQTTRFFEGSNSLITGIMDYHNGLTDTITGLVLSEDRRTLTMHFDEFPPTIIYFGVITAPIPAHIFSQIPVADMIDSDAVRTNPIGWGPFMFEHLVPGEAMSAVRNPNFVFGAPHIERINVRIIDPGMAADAMVAGEFDLISFRTLDYEYHQNPTNFRYLGSPSRTYGFVTFRMGHWDFDNHRNLPGPGRYINRPGGRELRRAMALAPDYLSLSQHRYFGLSFPAGAYLAPWHVDFMDLTVPMFPHDVEEANRILDEAGFTTRDAEGYRTWPDGEHLDIIWAQMEGPTAEFYYQFYTQAWRDIGVRVSLWEGTFHDANRIWDYMDFDMDNDEVVMWTGAWSVGANPNPSGVWGPGADWNASRHTSPEWEALLERLDSTEAWDQDYLMQIFSEIQWYKYENIFYFPTMWSVLLTAINNRVANWDTRPGQNPRTSGWHTIRLTAEAPYRG